MVPISQLWHIFEGNSRAQHIIRDFAVTACLVPYSRAASNRSQVKGTERSHPRQIAKNLVSDIFGFTGVEADDSDHDDDKKDIAIARTGYNASTSTVTCSAAPTILSFVLDTVYGEKQKPNLEETTWIKEVFSALAKAVGLDFASPSKSNIDLPGLTALSEMLRAFQVHKFSPGASIIRTVILYFCGLTEDHITDEQWKRLKQCIDIEHRVLTDTTPSPSTPEQGSQVLQLLLPRLSSADDTISQDSPHAKATSGAKAQLLLSILNAYIQTRAFANFLDIWRLQIEKQFESLSNLDYDALGLTIWESPLLYKAAVERLKLDMNTSQRIGLLDKTFSRLHEDASRRQLPERQYAGILVMSCILTAMSSSKQPEVPTKTALDFRNALASALLDPSFPTRFKHALWRPLSLIYETDSTCVHAEDGLVLLQNLFSLVVQSFKTVLSAPGEVGQNENALSALAFIMELWPVIEGLERETRIQYLKQLQDTIHNLTMSVAAYAKKASLGNETSKSVVSWRRIKFSLSSLGEFLISSCYIIQRHPATIQFV